ncbi:hypothetical protein AVDCRST_MAG92-1069 [uncultured Coleofasciculus sp.]|uniref:Uncharacterized protein n=1 Tax=uncultured Coleofasciculus sp. TaxID=1267456 RepID=A0A6J4HRP0_9CYAN|nr:hypothetical protein AVDCRST_MAG92-1069 [uncultured Coleofasciculus sp.]
MMPGYSRQYSKVIGNRTLNEPPQHRAFGRIELGDRYCHKPVVRTR